MIRPASQTDAGAIAAIWNHYIRETTVTFTTQEKTPQDVADYIETRQANGLCVFVAEIEGRVSGFSAASLFRSGPGYAHTLETSVMLHHTAFGGGVGRLLMGATETTARAGGASVLVAGISGENADAQAFHAKLGFVEVGRMPGVGRKFGRALDLVLMQKPL